VAMEACGSAHHWGRQLAALGHEVRLIPPAHVKPYVRRNKSDAADAAALLARRRGGRGNGSYRCARSTIKRR
jgi:transposase